MAFAVLVCESQGKRCFNICAFERVNFKGYLFAIFHHLNDSSKFIFNCTSVCDTLHTVAQSIVGLSAWPSTCQRGVDGISHC